MNVDSYLEHIPSIERAIRDGKPDALVCGMGPTAWLLRWIDQSLLHGVRLWGCHDGCRIMPMDDLVVMDSPNLALNPDTSRYRHILDARPKRLWIYENNSKPWLSVLAPAVKPITKLIDFSVCRPNQAPIPEKVKFRLVAEKPHTTGVSPTGMTTLAWREGCRRIGVVGVDMQKGYHHSYAWRRLIDHFFVTMAEQAHALGGSVFNVSPITSLQRFASWKPPTSTSAPTAGSAMQEPNESSNTPSASTPPATCPSTGCEAETKDSKSPATA